jgi:1,2-diacylglycerol 3-beta-glucosyltransferase
MNNIAELIIKLLVILLSFPAAYLLLVTIAAYLFKKENKAANRMLKVGVLIPAHNEETGILRTIKSIQAGSHPAECTSIFIVADNCTDKTAEIAQNAGATVMERTDTVNRGKGQVLEWFLKNQKKLYADIDVITIIDADVVADPEYLAEISLTFSQPGVQAFQGYNGVNNPRSGWRPGLLDAAFNVFNHLRMAGPAKLCGNCMLKGNGMAFSRALVEKFGWPCHSLVEDMEYSLLLLQDNINVHYNPDAIVRSDMVTSGKNASSQRNRWEEGRFSLIKNNGMQLLKSYFSTGKMSYIIFFAEMALPPLALLVLLFAFGTLAAFMFLQNGWITTVIIWWLILILYVVSGQLQRKAPLSTWIVLLTAPFFILWKIPLYISMIFSKKTNEWVRTTRET